MEEEEEEEGEGAGKGGGGGGGLVNRSAKDEGKEVRANKMNVVRNLFWHFLKG